MKTWLWPTVIPAIFGQACLAFWCCSIGAEVYPVSQIHRELVIEQASCSLSWGNVVAASKAQLAVLHGVRQTMCKSSALRHCFNVRVALLPMLRFAKETLRGAVPHLMQRQLSWQTSSMTPETTVMIATLPLQQVTMVRKNVTTRSTTTMTTTMTNKMQLFFFATFSSWTTLSLWSTTLANIISQNPPSSNIM